MKIGPIDITIPMLVYTGVLVAGLILLAKMWFSNDDIRKEAMLRGKILRATYDSTPGVMSDGVDACQLILSSHPNKHGVRLYMGNLQLRQPLPRDAKVSFEEVANAADATAQEKSWALIGSGVAHFAAAAKEDKAKAAFEAELKFKKAVELDANADALSNLALIQMQKVPPNLVEAEKYCKLALGCTMPPSIKILEQLYGLNGVIQTRQSKPIDAILSYDQAHALNPVSKAGEEARRTATVLAALDKNLDPQARKDMCRKAEVEIKNYSKEMRVTVGNAVGVAWSMTRGAPDYMDVGQQAAMKHFKQAMDEDPKDPRAYGNMNGLLEARISDLSEALKGNVTGLKGETPKLNVWKPVATDRLTRYAVEDNPKLHEIRKILITQEQLWQKFLEKNISASLEQKTDAKMRQLTCARRLSYILDIGEESQRPGANSKCIKLIEDMIKIDPTAPIVYFAKGEVLLDQDKYMEAWKAFDQAAKLYADKKIAPPGELAELHASLGKKPQLLNRFPKEGERWFGSKPVIGCTVTARTNAGPLKAEMKLGDKSVVPTVAGTQVLYCPTDAEISDGNQTVTLKVTDAMGQVLDIEPFSFYLDRRPPNLTIVPEAGSQIPPKAQWTVRLTDPAGVDPSTVTITIKNAKTAAAGMMMVKAGLSKMVDKPGLIKPQEFELVKDLIPGEYILEISAQDGAGNVLTQSLKYVVKAAAITSPK